MPTIHDEVKQLARMLVDDARRLWGVGFERLSDDQRIVEIDAAVMRTVLTWRPGMADLAFIQDVARAARKMVSP